MKHYEDLSCSDLIVKLLGVSHSSQPCSQHFHLTAPSCVLVRKTSWCRDLYWFTYGKKTYWFTYLHGFLCVTAQNLSWKGAQKHADRWRESWILLEVSYIYICNGKYWISVWSFVNISVCTSLRVVFTLVRGRTTWIKRSCWNFLGLFNWFVSDPQ